MYAALIKNQLVIARLERCVNIVKAKCAVFMERAMVCDPPATKIGKYTFRLDKVRDEDEFMLSFL